MEIDNIPGPIKYAAATAFQGYYSRKNQGSPFSIGIDTVFIKVVTETIGKVMSYLKDKYGDYEKALKVLKNPGIFQKWQFKRILKKNMNKYNVSKEKFQELYDILWGKKDSITRGEFESLWYNRV